MLHRKPELSKAENPNDRTNNMATSPSLNIPISDNTVDVSIIDTTSHIRIDTARFFGPEIRGNETLQACCYSFLIQHHNPFNPSKYDTLIFDLGVRKDYENSPKVLTDMLKYLPSDAVKVEKSVSTILEENGVALDTVGGVIWSHHHFDHMGDPSLFPSSTDLIVGPGFKKAFVPAWPTVPDAPVDERAWAGREVVEIAFNSDLKVGEYPAYDFYGDGSFYLLDTPGHAIGHIAALARTSANPPEFMFLGGDIAHHGGEFRPTEYLPLPKEISPNPLKTPFTASAPPCPGSIFEAIHPERSNLKPFYRLTEGGIHFNTADAQESLDRMHVFDAQENILIAIAHDHSLYDLYEYFPEKANGWSSKGWKREGRWRFLRDFEVGEKLE